MSLYEIHEDPQKMLTERQMKYVVQDILSTGLIVLKYNQETGVVTCGGSRHFWALVKDVLKEFFQKTPQYISKEKLGKKALSDLPRDAYLKSNPKDIHTQNTRIMYTFKLERKDWFEIQKSFDNCPRYAFIPVKTHGRIL